MDRILDRLWCGDFEDGYRAVHSRPDEWTVQHVVNLSQTPYYSPYGQVTVFHIHDELFLDPATWTAGTNLIHSLLMYKEPVYKCLFTSVLVHCRLGKSRAPAMCAAYLIRCGYSPEKALKLVKLQRHLADPHPETWRSVVAWAQGA